MSDHLNARRAAELHLDGPPYIPPAGYAGEGFVSVTHQAVGDDRRFEHRDHRSRRRWQRWAGNRARRCSRPRAKPPDRGCGHRADHQPGRGPGAGAGHIRMVPRLGVLLPHDHLCRDGHLQRRTNVVRRNREHLELPPKWVLPTPTSGSYGIAIRTAPTAQATARRRNLRAVRCHRMRHRKASTDAATSARRAGSHPRSRTAARSRMPRAERAPPPTRQPAAAGAVRAASPVPTDPGARASRPVAPA